MISETIESDDNLIIKRGKGRPKKELKPENNEPIIKKPRGRPRVENPCKPGCPKGGNEYFKAYYRSHNAGNIINCPSCNAFTEKFNLRNHMRSKMCVKYSQFAKCQIENSTSIG